jgi:uncharacterized protein involved in outer membrane biogenesis
MNDERQSLLLRRLLRTFYVALAALVVVLAAVSLLRIPLPLDNYKPFLEQTVGKSLGRGVAIDGGVTVTTSLWPYFEIEGLRIANPAGFKGGDLASMAHARVTIGLVALVQGKLRVRDFSVNGLHLDLVRGPGGVGNWVLDGAAEDNAADPNTPDSPELTGDRVAVDQLSLRDIRVSFREGEQEPPLEFVMQEAQGAAAAGEPMTLSMQGDLLDETFDLQVEASSLPDFLAMSHSRLELRLQIAGTRFDFSGFNDSLRGDTHLQLAMSMEGNDLSSLDDLLGLDLPPLQNYRLSAELLVEPDRLELTSFETGVGGSELTGSMVIDRRGDKPVATLDLASPLIRLDDFETGDWTAGDAPEAAEEPEPDEPADTGQQRKKLLSPETLARADVRLTAKVDEVRSGRDLLGSGELQVDLRSGRIDLSPLRLDLPESSLSLELSFEPGQRSSAASMRLLVESFDFGALTRLLDPASEVGGTIDLDVDVEASAGSLRNILSGANGYLDLSVHPENLKSGLVDLWAVNLLSAVVSSAISDEDASEINCAIGRFRITEGIMEAEQLAVDTSRIRICGEGQVSFVEERFDLEVAPSPKRAEYFNLATPMAVRGEFEDFSIGMKSGALTLGRTAAHFVTSPVTTTVKRLFKRELPADGADMCALPIGPREGDLEPLPGC